MEESHTMGMLSYARPFRDVYFPRQLWHEETIVPISYMRSLRPAWKVHGRPAPEASSSLEKEEDQEP